jgi:hypothetical protein
MSTSDDASFDFSRAPALSATAVAAFSLAPHLFLPGPASLGFAAVLLGVIAGVYFGFAIMNGTFRDQLTELLVASGFGLAALLGLTLSPWLLPAAYVGHGLWDCAHHNRAKLGLVHIPQWYVPWCAAIDLVIALGLVVVWRLHGVL